MSAHEEILTVAHHYFDGLFHGDVALLRKIFHPEAKLFGEVKGQPYMKSLEDYLTVVASRKSPHDLGETRRMAVISVEVTGSVGVVHAHCPMLGYNYHDYLSFCGAGDRWQIVNKLFTHVSPEA